MELDHSTDTISPDDQPALTIGGTGGLVLPVGTTAERPGSPSLATVRWNTTTESLELFNSSSVWSGATSPGINHLGKYVAITNNQSATDPGAGNLKWNNSTQSSATQLYIDSLTSGGFDATAYFTVLNTPLILYMQDWDDASVFQRWTVSSITDNTGWFTFAITYIDGAGSFGNNKKLAITVVNNAAGGGGVTTFSAGTTGFTPNSATSGAITLAGTLNAVNGGTGISSYAVGDLLQASNSTTLSKLPAVATGNVLISGGVGTVSSWGKVGLTTHISGTLAIGNGGTGATATPTNGQLLIGNGTSYTAATLGTGTGISITAGSGSLQVNNTGVTSAAATTNQTTVSGATGAVTIGLASTLVTPGSLQITTSLQRSATNTISAAGTTQGTATALTTDYNVVTTVASNAGVVLPSGVAGRIVVVVNRGANTLNVYPASGGTIDSLASNAAATINSGLSKSFESITTTQWYTVADTATGGGGGSPGGSDTQIQYNNAGSFAGAAGLTWNATTNVLTLGDTDTGIILTGVTNEPAVPAAGTGRLYSKSIAGRIVPKWVGPSGVDYFLQPSIGGNNVRAWRGGNTTTATTFASTMGTMPYTGASPVAPTIPALAATNLKTQTARSVISTNNTAGTLAYIRGNQLGFWRGNAAGLGGYFVVIRFALNALQSGMRVFAGVQDTAANPTNVNPTTNTTPGKIGMAIAANTGNWNLVHNVTGTAPTIIALSTDFPVDTTSLYELALFCIPNGSNIGYRVTNLSTNKVTSGTITTNQPANTTFLTPSVWITNNATAAAASMDFVSTYVETDF